MRELVAELGSATSGGPSGDDVSVSGRVWAVISERLGTGRSTGALQQHWCAAAAAAAARARARARARRRSRAPHPARLAGKS